MPVALKQRGVLYSERSCVQVERERRRSSEMCGGWFGNTSLKAHAAVWVCVEVRPERRKSYAELLVVVASLAGWCAAGHRSHSKCHQSACARNEDASDVFRWATGAKNEVSLCEAEFMATSVAKSRSSVQQRDGVAESARGHVW